MSKADSTVFWYCDKAYPIDGEALAAAMEAPAIGIAIREINRRGYNTKKHVQNLRAIFKRFKQSKLTWLNYIDREERRSHFGETGIDPVIPDFNDVSPEYAVSILSHALAYKILIKAYQNGEDVVDQGLLKTILSKSLGQAIELKGAINLGERVCKDMPSEKLMEKIKELTGNGPQV